MLLVEKLKQEEFNPIDIRSTEFIPNYMQIKHKSFVIGIQTKQQLLMMQRKWFENYLAADEFNKGYIIGHLIPNQQDELTQSLVCKK